MREEFRRMLTLAGLWMVWSLSGSLTAAEIHVLAAASLKDSLTEIAKQYERASGDKVVLNLGASSTLARQIEEGAPADVFFSADEAKMDALDKRGLIDKETRRSPLSNTLVIVVAADRPVKIESPEDLAGPQVKRLALADPRSVPAGIYAKRYLERISLWSAVESKVVPTEHVRAALAAVESWNAEAAIVYRTDAAISKSVKVAWEVPAAQTPEISYSLAVLKEARESVAARRFLRHLESGEAGQVFRKFGFIVRDREDGP